MKCTYCGRTISPNNLEAMKDKYGRLFCDGECACDYYCELMGLDLMSLYVVDFDEYEIEGECQ